MHRTCFWLAGQACYLAAPPAAQAPLDAAAHRIAGTASRSEYKVSAPENDLDGRVEGFPIVPPMGTGSWSAFTPARHRWGRSGSTWRSFICAPRSLRAAQLDKRRTHLTL